MWELMDTWCVTTEYRRVQKEELMEAGPTCQNVSVWKIHPTRWDLGWHQDTERGQRWALCWWHNLLAVGGRERGSVRLMYSMFFLCYRQVLPPLLCTHVKRFASLKEAASSRSLSINTDNEDFKRLCSRMPATRVTSSSEEEFEFMKISRAGAEAATNCRSEFDFPTVPRFLSILIMEETLHSLLHRSCTTHHHRSVRVSGKWWGQRYVCGRSNSAVKQFIISCVVRFQGLTR